MTSQLDEITMEVRLAGPATAVLETLRLMSLEEPSPGVPSPAATSAVVVAPWQRGDEARAQQLLSESTPDQQRVLLHLARHPAQSISNETLAEVAGLAGKAPQAIGGVFSWFGGRCEKLGRTLPYEGAGKEFKMSAEVAAMFTAAAQAIGLS